VIGKKILVTGAAGQIAYPLALALAQHNDVWGIARFSDPARRAVLEDAGVTTRVVDLGDPDFSHVPDDFDHVLHLAAYLGGGTDFDYALDVDAVGTGLLLSHVRSAASVLVMSTTGVYRAHADPYHRYVETDPLGDPVNPAIPTYGVCKVAEEAVARFCARAFDVPVVIARMNASYGDTGGLPAKHLDRIVAGETIRLRSDPAPYSPIHDDDILAHLDGLLAAASTPASVVNFGGDTVVTAQEWCAHLGELVGIEPVIEVVPVPGSQPGIALDVTKRASLTGPDRVHWRDGMRQMAQARHGDLVALGARES
jgi:nucleoside-diphosphate-sugar epimerase